MHSRERKEKNCLNCGATVQGPYCQQCGQQNVEPEETFGQLVTHFVADLFHFDGKFFVTLKYLFSRPGFLSLEYIRGRRQKYLHPVKMFIFTTAIFFFIYFSFVYHPQEISAARYKDLAVITTIQNLRDSLQAEDSVGRSRITAAIQTLEEVFPNRDSSEGFAMNYYAGTLPSTVHAYDSIQKTLPADKRDNAIERMINRKQIERAEGGKIAQNAFAESYVEHFMKSIPQMLFVSLPLLALFLKLLFVRRKHRWNYVDHVIFLIHAFIAIYLLMLVQLGWQALRNATGAGIFTWLSAITYICVFSYPYIAMYRFYKQGWFKTFIKYVLLLIFASIIIILLIFLFAVYTFFSV